MNEKDRKLKKVKTRFKPETRFEVGPVPTNANRGEVETELEQLKARLLAPLLKEATDPAKTAPLRLAANEAAGLAWFTPFPLLFFPALLEEKIYAAERQETRQRLITAQTRPLVEETVV